jgi:hypothetical protein
VRQFEADNPGFWLLEAAAATHVGAKLVLSVLPDERPALPADWTYRPAPCDLNHPDDLTRYCPDADCIAYKTAQLEDTTSLHGRTPPCSPRSRHSILLLVCVSSRRGPDWFRAVGATRAGDRGVHIVAVGHARDAHGRAPDHLRRQCGTASPRETR